MKPCTNNKLHQTNQYFWNLQALSCTMLWEFWCWPTVPSRTVLSKWFFSSSTLYDVTSRMWGSWWIRWWLWTVSRIWGWWKRARSKVKLVYYWVKLLLLRKYTGLFIILLKEIYVNNLTV